MHSKQQGASLLSLMIGLVISSVAIIAMLNLYRSMTQNAVIALSDAKTNGQQATATLTAQMEVQGAGFGISNAADLQKSLLLVTPASLSKSQDDQYSYTVTGTAKYLSEITSGTAYPEGNNSGVALLWATVQDPTQITPTYDCAGLIASYAGLKLLKSTNCTLTSITNKQLNNIKWTVTELVNDDPPTDATTLSKDSYTKFTLNKNASCWPFGQSAIVASISTIELKIELRNSFWADTSTDGNRAYLKQSITSCLTNFSS